MAPGVTPTSPCDAADIALQTGNLETARNGYQALQKEDSPPSCAAAGLLNVTSAELSLQQAVSDESAGLDESAQKLVATLAASYPEADYTLYLQARYAGITDPAAAVRTIAALQALHFGRAAEHLLASLGAKLHLPNKLFETLTGISRAGPFGAAVLLERSGLHDEALAEFKKVLAADPSAAALALSTSGHPQELDELSRRLKEEEGPANWSNFKHYAIPVAKVIGEVVLVLLLALVVFRILRTALRSPTEIKDFVDTDATGGSKTAKDLTALVRASVDRLSADLPGTNLNVVSALEAPISLPASVASDTPEVKVFAALLDLLQKVLPQRGWTVTGQLLSKSARGEGLALRLATANGGVLADAELWQEDFSLPLGTTDSTPMYDRLAIPAATWIVYQITDAIWKNPRNYVLHPIARAKLGRRRKLIPTTEWRSYACFAVASRIQSDDQATATFLYERALRYDSANRAALYNRAVLDIENRDWDLAADRLERLENEFVDPSDRRDLLWYRCKYMSAVLEMNRELDCAAKEKRDPALGPFENAKELLARGLEAMEEKLIELEPGTYFFGSPSDQALYQSLIEFEGPYVYALAGVVARLEGWQEAEEG